MSREERVTDLFLFACGLLSVVGDSLPGAIFFGLALAGRAIVNVNVVDRNE